MINKTELKVALTRMHMSQRELAIKIKMSENTLTSRLNGRSEFKIDEANRICKALNITDSAKKAEIFFD